MAEVLGESKCTGTCPQAGDPHAKGAKIRKGRGEIIDTEACREDTEAEKRRN
jgi:hypothetical protein